MVQFLWISLVWVLVFLPVVHAEITFSGRVVDENDQPISGAQVSIRAEGQPVVQATTDPTGVFHASVPVPGRYVIDAQREGYFELRNQEFNFPEAREITLVLSPVREVFQTVNLNETPSPVNLAQTDREERLTGTEINDIPYPSSHSLRNAMRLMPQVVEDPTGALHFAGSAENQVLYVLNGFDVTDPITGRFNTRVGVDGIRSLQFWTGRFSPEYGKGSAGFLAINTDNGADVYRYTATNFIPGLDTNHGLHLGGWTPRFGVSGPLVKGRAWFADNFDFQYTNSFVNGLPKGQNDKTGWAGSNLFHTQINLTPSNILFTDFLVNFDNQWHAGLGPLDPISTTLTNHNREYFWSARDQIYIGHGVLVELGLAQNRFDERSIPQGTVTYVLSPQGQSGNYFVNSAQHARRDQLLANGYLPRFNLAGPHQLKMGVDLDRLNYYADIHRTAFERLGLAGEILSITTFAGSGTFRRPNSETSSFIVDDWKPRENVTVQMGVRQDWDELVRHISISPRVSASWSPFASGRTKVSAGYAITYDATPLVLFAQPLDQVAVTQSFTTAGTPVGPPAQATFTIPYGHLQAPGYTNYSATFDQQLTSRTYVSVDYLRRSGDHGFTYISGNSEAAALAFSNQLPYEDLAGHFVLSNLRRDRYQSVEFSVHQSLTKQYEWYASYVRSKAISNAVLDLGVDQVLQVINNLGPEPWDAPNRFLAGTYLPLPWKNWAFAALADARSGFPYSVIDETGRVIGAVDSHRYPTNFELNLHLERTFVLRGYRFALRGGLNNITNSRNATAVSNVVGAPNFGQFLGTEGRHFQVRIRFFGRS